MVLIAGGAGYIGSHTVQRLIDLGYQVVVLDNLTTGHRILVPKQAIFYEGDIGDRKLVSHIIKTHDVVSVMNFAAMLRVEESVSKPDEYYENNFIKGKAFINTCIQMKIRHYIFSSTCAIYGAPQVIPVDEKAATLPLNPYGKSKLMIEWYLEDLSRAMKLGMMNYVCLRYFNVAGAWIEKKLGQATPQATQLIKVASEVALGKRLRLEIFGKDYETSDGTCIRDYIHVRDLVEAHILSLSFLKEHLRNEVFNCGYGHGYSVREVVDTVKRISGVDFAEVYQDRRAGDAPKIFAEPKKIKEVLGWTPQFDDLNLIVNSSLAWEKIMSEVLQ